MSSSTLKGSSAAGLMDPYSRDRESSAGFVIHRPNYPLGEEPFHIQPQPPLTRLQAILLHKIYNSASSKRCWAEVPQRLHLRFFFSFKPQEANDFHSSFLSGYGPRETMTPITDLLNWIPHKNRFLWDLQLILYFVKYINSASQTWFFSLIQFSQQSEQEIKLNGEPRPNQYQYREGNRINLVPRPNRMLFPKLQAILSWETWQMSNSYMSPVKCSREKKGRPEPGHCPCPFLLLTLGHREVPQQTMFLEQFWNFPAKPFTENFQAVLIQMAWLI